MPHDEHVVTLHIGTPKSGTTFLQRQLSRHRVTLLEHGFLYPGERPSHFIEAMSLRERGFRGHQYDAAEGAWDRLVAEIMDFDGPALISHEMIGGSTTATIERAVQSFPGRRVRVVITCRDLGRQLPAVWQEGIKNGNTERYADFLAQSFEAWNGPSGRQGLWAGQNLAGMGRRWGGVVGHDHVVLVTVPPAGAGTGDLWDRFGRAVGLPEADYSLAEKPGNPSLGTVETELLRRFTERLPDSIPWPERSRKIKRRFAQGRLVAQQAGGALSVPEADRAPTREIAAEMVQALRADGFGLEGDLADLDPSFRAEGTMPDDVDDAALLDLALDLLVPLVLADEQTGPRRGRAAPAPAPAPVPAPKRRSLARRVGRRLRR